MIDPMTSNVAVHATEQAAVHPEAGGPGGADQADQTRFEAALNGPAESTTGDAPTAVQNDPTVRDGATLGEALLDQIEALKDRCDAARDGIKQRLAAIQDGEFTAADVIRLQQDLAAFNLQATFAGKVTEEVNQGIQTMMKSQ